MPAPPEIKVAISQAAFERLCRQLGLKKDYIVTLKRAEWDVSTLRGTAAVDGKVTIYYGIQSQQINKLRYVQAQIVRTVLHEMRHQFQFENWSEGQWAIDEKYEYNIKPSEIDAREFADNNLAKYRDLVKVERKGQSRFGRLSAAEGRARR